MFIRNNLYKIFRFKKIEKDIGLLSYKRLFFKLSLRLYDVY